MTKEKYLSLFFQKEIVMPKESNYFFLDTTVGNFESRRLAELNAFTKVEKIIQNIDIKRLSFQEMADYVSSFDSIEDKKYVLNELRIQFVHKLDCDFEEIQPFLPNIFGNSFMAAKVLEKSNFIGLRQIKLYYSNDDQDIHSMVMPLHLFLSAIVEHFMNNLVVYNPHYFKKIPESKIEGSEKNILLETYSILNDHLKKSNIDIGNLTYWSDISSVQLKILKRYSSHLTIRQNPYSKKNFYETLVELFIFYSIHNEIIHADFRENNKYFENVSLHKLSDFSKYVKKNQILAYTICYFAKIKKVDEKVLKKIWKAVFKPSRNSTIDTSKIFLIPEPLINIDKYIPSKNLMECSLYDYLK